MNANRNDIPHYTPPAGEPAHRRRRRLIILLWSCIAIIAVIVGGVTLPYLLSTAHSTHTIHIPEGATGKVLRDTLMRHYDRQYADKVLAVMHLTDDKPVGRSGAYTVTDGMSAFGAARLFMNGSQTPVRLTINGFRNAGTLATRIAMRLQCDSTAIATYMNNPEFLAKYGLTPERVLCLFIDDSYEVYWDDTPEDVIARFTAQYEKVWNKERRAKAEALGLTPAEVMIVCSIVDEETNADEEKDEIGRLYINRLQKGMRLQADPTIRYAHNDFTIRRVTKAHLNIDSPYNTYRHEGLPPGPIRTTSVTTIDAVLDSKPSDYLYMCAKDDFSGTHNFSADYATHQQNAISYQNALNRRGIK